MVYDAKDGFHKGTIVACVLFTFSWTLFGAMVLPNTPFLIKSYFPNIIEADVGTYSGVLTAMYYVGQIPGCIIWGNLADRFGRKWIMTLTLFANCVCILAFGMSTNFVLSLVIRFLHGILDGSIPLCKTIISEISNESNIALGTSLFFVGSALGGLIGPIAGGFLSKKENIKPLIKLFPILADRPFLLPFSISALLLLISTVVFMIFSIDTMSKEELQTAQQMKRDTKINFSLIRDKRHSQRDLHENLLMTYAQQSSSLHLFKQRDFCLVMIVFGVVCFVQMAFDTLLPVALAGPISLGGMELDREGISTVAGVCSPFLLVMVLFMPLCSRLFLYKSQFGFYLASMSLLIILLPVVLKTIVFDSIVVYSVLVIYHIILGLARGLCLNIGIVLFANLSCKEVRATVMGIGQTVGGICRFLGPFLIPALYSWSCKVGGKIINSYFSFYLLGAIGIASSFLVCAVSAETNKSKGTLAEYLKNTGYQSFTN